MNFCRGEDLREMETDIFGVRLGCRRVKRSAVCWTCLQYTVVEAACHPPAESSCASVTRGLVKPTIFGDPTQFAMPGPLASAGGEGAGVGLGLFPCLEAGFQVGGRHGLYVIGGRAEAGGALKVHGVLGAAQYGDVERRFEGIGADPLQDLEAVAGGHLEIEKDEIGALGGAATGGIDAGLEVIDRFQTVENSLQLAADVVLLQRPAKEERVVIGVFGEEDAWAWKGAAHGGDKGEVCEHLRERGWKPRMVC